MTRQVIHAIALTSLLVPMHPGLAVAAKQKRPEAPAPAAPPIKTTAEPDSSAPARVQILAPGMSYAPLTGGTVLLTVKGPVTLTSGPVSRTPGPVLAPGSPIADRTTIVPFPIPGDTSRAASERAKMMNLPREGVTALEPLPRSGGTGYEIPYVFPRGSLRFSVPPDHIDVLPEMLTQPEPEYPQAARDAGIEGTVLVMARVLAGGTVGETMVVKSVLGLDDAAVQAVKRLRFKPATLAGKPVAAWVGVPVRFTLH